MPAAALFDVDGTLVDSNAFHAEAWRRAFRRHGVDLAFEAIQLQIGKGGDNLVPSLLPPDQAAAIGPAVNATRKRIFAADYQARVQPFPGVPALFAGLRERGVRVVLASSAPAKELAANVERLGVADLVHGTVSADAVEHSKPAPDVFAAALVEAGCGPEDAVVIGDSPWDVVAAARLGVPAVALRCGGFDGAMLLAAGARAVFDGPWALPADPDAWLSAGHAAAN